MMRHYLRDGKLEKACELAQRAGDKVAVACLDKQWPEDVVKPAEEQNALLFADPDPEVHYVVVQNFVSCDRKDVAMRLLKEAVGSHYCAYSGLQKDSFWAKLRGTPEFTALEADAKRCRDEFLAKREEAAQ